MSVGVFLMFFLTFSQEWIFGGAGWFLWLSPVEDRSQEQPPKGLAPCDLAELLLCRAFQGHHLLSIQQFS